MRIQYRLLTLTLIAGCTNPQASENQLTDKDKLDSVVIESLVTDENDSLSYIGYINKFEDNDSFYTDLYFTDNFKYDLYDEITKKGGPVVFKDEEIQRTRMEIEKVGDYFNLTGLQSIDIYNDKSQKLTTGRLSHIEYVEDIIESRFVAVFQVDDPNIIDPSFCIGKSNDVLTKIDFTSYKDEKLKSELIDFLKLNTGHIWITDHYKFDNQIISTISADTTAYIIETIDNAHKTLYKSSSSEEIHSLTPISKRINGRHILMTGCGMPETDMLWTSVLVFNGTEYKTSKDHRVEKYRR